MRYQLLVVMTISLCTVFFATKINATASLAIKQGMVVSEDRLASTVGANILRAGGNAIDAAVAVGYALAVVNPCCGNIGGGGFMTLHLANGKNIFINFREKAPLKAHKDMFLDTQGNIIPNKTTDGYLAVAVPGTVMGLNLALKKYGTMTRAQVMSPAIQLAQQGYIITPYAAKQFAKFADDFKKSQNIAHIFLRDGKTYQAGERLVQKNLARTLQLIADEGTDAFYKGPIAAAIVKASQTHGGILTLADFANYHAQISTPIQCQYHGYTIVSAPPPSSGGVTLCELTNILENFPLRSYGYRSTQSISTIIEAMRYAFKDRNTQLGDPDFVDNPLQQLLSKEYAKQIAKKIRDTYFIPHADHPAPPKELTDTTHYSVVDAKGNAAAVTYTLNGFLIQ